MQASTLTIWTLLALQTFQVLFLCLHDWIPLGTLNDVQAVRAENPGGRLLRTTLLSAAPYVFGLAASFVFLGRHYPDWLYYWLLVSYGLLFLGQLRAWWVPYFFAPDPVRAARYKIMFGKTQAFLPERNGIRPNTLHIILHAATLVTLLLLTTGFSM
jgi:hypothetical protein